MSEHTKHPERIYASESFNAHIDGNGEWVGSRTYSAFPEALCEYLRADTVYPAAVVQRLVEAARKARGLYQLGAVVGIDQASSGDDTKDAADIAFRRAGEITYGLDAALAEVGRVGKNAQEPQQ